MRMGTCMPSVLCSQLEDQGQLHPAAPAELTEALFLRLGLKGWEISIEKEREGGEKESISRRKNYFCEGKDEGSTQESDAVERCGA